jgi:hypothetical protein
MTTQARPLLSDKIYALIRIEAEQIRGQAETLESAVSRFCSTSAGGKLWNQYVAAQHEQSNRVLPASEPKP